MSFISDILNIPAEFLDIILTDSLDLYNPENVKEYEASAKKGVGRKRKLKKEDVPVGETSWETLLRHSKAHIPRTVSEEKIDIDRISLRNKKKTETVHEEKVHNYALSRKIKRFTGNLYLESDIIGEEALDLFDEFLNPLSLFIHRNRREKNYRNSFSEENLPESSVSGKNLSQDFIEQDLRFSRSFKDDFIEQDSLRSSKSFKDDFIEQDSLKSSRSFKDSFYSLRNSILSSRDLDFIEQDSLRFLKNRFYNIQFTSDDVDDPNTLYVDEYFKDYKTVQSESIKQKNRDLKSFPESIKYKQKKYPLKKGLYEGITLKAPIGTRVIPKLQFDLKYRKLLDEMIEDGELSDFMSIDTAISVSDSSLISQTLSHVPLDGVVSLTGPIPTTKPIDYSYFAQGGSLLDEDKNKVAEVGPEKAVSPKTSDLMYRRQARRTQKQMALKAQNVSSQRRQSSLSFFDKNNLIYRANVLNTDIEGAEQNKNFRPSDDLGFIFGQNAGDPRGLNLLNSQYNIGNTEPSRAEKRRIKADREAVKDFNQSTEASIVKNVSRNKGLTISDVDSNGVIDLKDLRKSDISRDDLKEVEKEIKNRRIESLSELTPEAARAAKSISVLETAINKSASKQIRNRSEETELQILKDVRGEMRDNPGQDPEEVLKSTIESTMRSQGYKITDEKIDELTKKMQTKHNLDFNMSSADPVQRLGERTIGLGSGDENIRNLTNRVEQIEELLFKYTRDV